MRLSFAACASEPRCDAENGPHIARSYSQWVKPDSRFILTYKIAFRLSLNVTVPKQMAARETSAESVIFLSDLPATPEQRRLVLAVAVLLLVAFAFVAPFAHVPMHRFDAFIPSLQAIIFVNDLITSVLLFAHYAIVPGRALLALASGYLFTALIVIPHALTFPGAFSSTGLLGAGLQSTGWLYYFWHIGAPIAVLAYACLKDTSRPSTANQGSAAKAIGWSVAAVVALVLGLTWTATAGDWFLPAFFSDSTRHVRGSLYILIPLILLVGFLALAVLWVRRRSVLDYWLMLAVYALILEEILIALLSGARFSLGFYAGRAFSLITSIIVLVLLLSETTRLYARLARSHRLLEHERDNKLMNVEAITASIAHEVSQPLTAIASGSSAAIRFLDGAQPDIPKVQALLKKVNSESHRAGEVFESIRALFRKVDLEREPVDLNDVTLEVLKSFREALHDSNVIARIELTTELPTVEGHRSQLRQVIFNLVHNSLEAMEKVTGRSRTLLLRTELQGRDTITVIVEDSGPGIDPKQLDGIFEAFVTTKSHGMGLGLAICRAIAERHGGQLSAVSDGKYGAKFTFSLPLGSSTKEAPVRAE
ncbi:MAG TPA: MASE4 domain-containing protein [Pseudolabrys sp.]|nr:MASE4 domain-containing protein [Pseudolabrys sp.]